MCPIAFEIRSVSGLDYECASAIFVKPLESDNAIVVANLPHGSCKWAFRFPDGVLAFERSIGSSTEDRLCFVGWAKPAVINHGLVSTRCYDSCEFWKGRFV